MSNATHLVFVKDNAVVTDSLVLAREFGKEHKHILEKIRFALSEVSSDFGRSNFRLSSYTNEQDKEQPLYELTRDGWMYAVMGFTGKKAGGVAA